MIESQAIKQLKDILGECTESDEAVCYVTNVDAPVLKIAINALEKQIPKKPTIYTKDKDRLACCPVCDSNVDWTYEGFWRKGNPKYCRECGQRIDFESEM